MFRPCLCVFISVMMSLPSLAFSTPRDMPTPSDFADDVGVELLAQAGNFDIVRTNDGRLMRGTIVEVDEGKHISIMLVTGETRTVPFSSVESYDFAEAGTDDANEGSDTSSAEEIEEIGFEVRMTSEDGEPVAVREILSRSTNQGWGSTIELTVYDDICETDCTAVFPDGSQELNIGFQRKNGRFRYLSMRRPLEVEEAMDIEFYRIRRRGARIGVTTGGVALLGLGGYLLYRDLASVSDDDDSFDFDDDSVDDGSNTGLLIAAVTALVAGSIMAGYGPFIADKADYREKSSHRLTDPINQDEAILVPAPLLPVDRRTNTASLE